MHIQIINSWVSNPTILDFKVWIRECDPKIPVSEYTKGYFTLKNKVLRFLWVWVWALLNNPISCPKLDMNV